MMQLTKCEDTSLVQLEKQPVEPKAQICETHHGFELNFGDAKKQAKLEKMMTPGARKAINELLGQMQATQAKQAASLLQGDAKPKAKGKKKLASKGGKRAIDD